MDTRGATIALRGGGGAKDIVLPHQVQPRGRGAGER